MNCLAIIYMSPQLAKQLRAYQLPGFISPQMARIIFTDNTDLYLSVQICGSVCVDLWLGFHFSDESHSSVY